MLLLATAIVLVLIVLNGVFAMSELAVVSSRRTKLQSRAEKGDRGAAAALKLAEDPTRFLSAVQVGITLIGILAGAFGQATIAAELDVLLETVPGMQAYSEVLSTGLVVVLLTYLSLIVGELVPKRVALVFPETIAATMARPLNLMSKLMGPFVTLLTASTAAVLKVIGVRESNGEAITKEEVETVLSEGMSAGLIEPQEQAMMSEIMLLGDRPVRVAMTPRREVYWVALGATEAGQREAIMACPYSRFVVARAGESDHPLGVVHKKDVLDLVLRGEALDLSTLLQTPLQIPNSTSLLKALEMFRATPVHMAFVINEYGALEGVLTPTDILEMIAGDFNETHDVASETIVRREDGSILVDGRTDLLELAEVLGDDFGHPAGGYHTVAGLLLHTLSRLPVEGEIVRLGRYTVEVIDMDDRRIDKLLFSLA